MVVAAGEALVLIVGGGGGSARVGGALTCTWKGARVRARAWARSAQDVLGAELHLELLAGQNACRHRHLRGGGGWGVF